MLFPFHYESLLFVAFNSATEDDVRLDKTDKIAY